jgi:hypothetical protein
MCAVGLLAGCNNSAAGGTAANSPTVGGSSSTTTVADHGGYLGKAAKLYDASELTCTRDLAAGPPSRAEAKRNVRAMVARLDPHGATEYAAILAGCEDAARAYDGVSGTIPALSETTSGP